MMLHTNASDNKGGQKECLVIDDTITLVHHATFIIFKI